MGASVGPWAAEILSVTIINVVYKISVIILTWFELVPQTFYLGQLCDNGPLGHTSWASVGPNAAENVSVMGHSVLWGIHTFI